MSHEAQLTREIFPDSGRDVVPTKQDIDQAGTLIIGEDQWAVGGGDCRALITARIGIWQSIFGFANRLVDGELYSF